MKNVDRRLLFQYPPIRGDHGITSFLSPGCIFLDSFIATDKEPHFLFVYVRTC